MNLNYYLPFSIQYSKLIFNNTGTFKASMLLTKRLTILSSTTSWRTRAPEARPLAPAHAEIVDWCLDSLVGVGPVLGGSRELLWLSADANLLRKQKVFYLTVDWYWYWYSGTEINCNWLMFLFNKTLSECLKTPIKFILIFNIADFVIIIKNF